MATSTSLPPSKYWTATHRLDHAEVIVGKGRHDGLVVVVGLVLEFGTVPVRLAVDEAGVESTGTVRHAEGVVAVGVGGAFLSFNGDALVIDVGLLERGLGENRHAGKLRRLVGERVVHAVAETEEDLAGLRDVVPTRAHGGGAGAHLTVAADTGIKTARAAGGEFAVRRLNEQDGFAVEKAGALVESAVVRLEAVFKVEANLVAVAEIFRALQAEAGAGVLTGTHAEAVGRGPCRCRPASS